MAGVATPALAERIRGKQQSRMRSLLAAGAVGAATGVLTYRWLRSTPDDGGNTSHD
jgi:hypothetical protein